MASKEDGQPELELVTWWCHQPLHKDLNVSYGSSHHEKDRLYWIVYRAKHYYWPFHWIPDVLMRSQHPMSFSGRIMCSARIAIGRDLLFSS